MLDDYLAGIYAAVALHLVRYFQPGLFPLNAKSKCIGALGQEGLRDAYIIHILSEMEVEWDPAKARANLKKHGVSFSDAEAVLYDPLAISMEDQIAEG